MRPQNPLNIFRVIVASLGLLCAACTSNSSAAPSPLPLFPWPAQVQPGAGELTLSDNTRIVTQSPELQPLADVLAGELFATTGLHFATASGEAGPHDIALSLDPKLATDTYTLTVSDNVQIQASSYISATWGTSTLVQLVGQQQRTIALPRVTINDHPHFPYPGLMIDVARNRISIDTLKQSVVLCHLYKIKFLQLHMSDDQGFTFPSTAFPNAGSKNGSLRGPAVQVYPIDQLRDLVHFADERGVTIVPEIEMPGHSGALQRSVPEIFGYKDAKTGNLHSLSVINLANEAIYPALDTLVGELCDVFKSSPYIHIGCDEVYFAELEKEPMTIQYLKDHNLRNVRELFPLFINRMNEIIKKHGKHTIVWEAFQPGEKVDKDVTVLSWDGWNFPAPDLVKAGYQTIHVPWTPGIGNSPQELYNWDPYLCHGLQVPHDAPLFGAMMVYWEQTDDKTIPMLRMKTPVRQERIWNTDAGRSFDDMAERFDASDRLLDRLLYHFDVDAQGLTNPRDTWIHVGVDNEGINTGFAKSLTVQFKPTTPGTIRYTLDGSQPTAQSPAFTQPITMQDTTQIRARLFDDSGKPIGFTWFTTYDFRPFNVKIEGTVTETDFRFGKTASLTAKQLADGGSIHYVLDRKGDAAVTEKSPVYSSPITIDHGQTVAMRYFDAQGKPHGYTWSTNFTQVDYDPTNITYHKPVTCSNHGDEDFPELAVSGVVQVRDFAHTFWGSSPGPQWIKIDLEKSYKLDHIQIYTYWDGHRYYQYTVEISPDGDHWTTVGDMSKNTQVSTPEGMAIKFAPTETRYIRVTMLRNSANRGLHLVQVRAYEAK